MSLAHAGSNIKDLIIPVDYQDTLFHFYWNKVSGRGHEPIQDITTIVPDSKFGQVIAIEIGTKNLCAISDSYWSINKSNYQGTMNVTTSQTGFSTSARFDFKPRADEGKTGWQVAQYNFPSFSFDTSKRYTLSFFARKINDYANSISVSIRNENGFNNVLNNVVKTLSARWDRYIITFTPLISGVKPVIYIISNESASFEIADPQIEQLGWATSFVNGTRSTGVLEYPKEMFPQKDFTVNMWISHTGDMRRAIYQSCKLFSLGSDVKTSRLTIWNFCPITPEAPNRRIISDYGNDDYGGRQYKDLIDPVLFVPGQWEMFTITFEYSTKKFTYYRNGNYWNTYTPAKLNPIHSVLLHDSGWKYSNLLISPRVFSQDEIRLLYHYGKPLYDPYNYYTVFGA